MSSVIGQRSRDSKYECNIYDFNKQKSSVMSSAHICTDHKKTFVGHCLTVFLRISYSEVFYNTYEVSVMLPGDNVPNAVIVLCCSPTETHFLVLLTTTMDSLCQNY